MIFSQAEFFAFFACFFGAYLLLRRQLFAQNLLIVIGSYVFYGWWDARFLMLIAASTAVDYVAGLLIAGRVMPLRLLLLPCISTLVLAVCIVAIGIPNPDTIWTFGVSFVLALICFAMIGRRLAPDRRRWSLVASVVFNLGMLGVFKYFNFFADSFAEFAGMFGWEPGFVTLNVVLPVGISFYTFQTMSYTLDIYRRQLQPTEDFVRFAAFVSFFPQLVAGPIERARNLLPQFEQSRTVDWQGLREGGALFLWGMYKKVAIADNLAPIADSVFADPAAAAPGQVVAAVLAFTFQIYCDFSGYSDMARGTARMLGFRLMVNFAMPYFSRTPSEFWERWHISLSSWLRDYLYIPLGGNRAGRLHTYRNLMLTMVLGGLWHGAAWTFVAWGFFHGAVLVAYRMSSIDARLEHLPSASPYRIPAQVAACLAMFLFAMLSWIFFRAENFHDAGIMLVRFWEPTIAALLGTVAWIVMPLVAIETMVRLTGRANPWDRVPGFLRLNLALFLLYTIVFLGADEAQNFIYFDF